MDDLGRLAVPVPVARSPIAQLAPEEVLAGWAVSVRRSTADLTLADLSPLAKILVKAPAGVQLGDLMSVPLGRAERRAAGTDGWEAAALVTHSAPFDWLVLSGTAAGEGLLRRLAGAAETCPELVTVVDLTHGRALVRLSGERAREVLAKECGLDLSDSVLPDGAAVRTAVAGVAADLVRDDVRGIEGSARLSYLLHCERASGQYLFDALLDAGDEFRLEVDGFGEGTSGWFG